MSDDQVFEFTLKTVHMNSAEIIRKRGLESGGKVQQFIDSEVLRRCQEYVPMDTGELIRSGVINTQIGSGEVVYETPYSRRWYYREAIFQGAPKRGTYWFERMKNDGGKDAILRGVKGIVGGS